MELLLFKLHNYIKSNTNFFWKIRMSLWTLLLIKIYKIFQKLFSNLSKSGVVSEYLHLTNLKLNHPPIFQQHSTCTYNTNYARGGWLVLWEGAEEGLKRLIIYYRRTYFVEREDMFTSHGEMRPQPRKYFIRFKNFGHRTVKLPNTLLVCV